MKKVFKRLPRWTYFLNSVSDNKMVYICVFIRFGKGINHAHHRTSTAVTLCGNCRIIQSLFGHSSKNCYVNYETFFFFSNIIIMFVAIQRLLRNINVFISVCATFLFDVKIKFLILLFSGMFLLFELWLGVCVIYAECMKLQFFIF